MKRKVHIEDENPFSLSIGDLMAAVLFVFVLLLSAAMLKMREQTDTIKEITNKYESNKEDIRNALETHFGDQLTEWGAEIIPDKLCVRFSEKSMFGNESSRLDENFKGILDDFFPQYIGLLMKYKDAIAEIRIEGHTSTKGQEGKEGYFYNMKLSQERSRNVLDYCWNLATEEQQEWMMKCVTANGLSYSHVIIKNGVEDEDKSRRVEFRILTKSEESMVLIKSELDEYANKGNL